MRIFVLLCLCIHLLGCSATNIGSNNQSSRSSSGSSVSSSTSASSSSNSGSGSSGSGSSGSGSSGSGGSGSGGSGSGGSGSGGSGSSARTFSNIEAMPGWYLYPDQGNPVCSPGPSLTSNPALDAASGMFHMAPTGPFNNCLWPILLGSSTTATHFTLDTYYRLSDALASQGVEFSSNKHIGTEWYKFSVQCSYNKGIFSVWDTGGAAWFPTSVPCTRPAQGSWDHLIVNTEIAGGKALFLSITFNGITHLINQSFYPVTKPSSYSFGVHFQMDGNHAGDPYETYVDGLTFTAW